MMKNTKKSKVIQKELEGKDIFKFDEALSITKKFASKKFDENLDISVGVISLPKMPKKDVKVAVFADGDDIKKAQDAGADIVGAEELIDKVKQGELNFDKCISTPKMMVKVSSLGQILGPKGLMPNPKLGTVTNDIKEGVKNIKSGQIEFKTDKAGIVHVPIGKVSFTDDEKKTGKLQRSIYKKIFY